MTEKCTMCGCPGAYERKSITHTVRFRGELMVIDRVPAEVCSICGDTLLLPETVRRIEQLLKSHCTPVRTVPLCEYA